MITPTMILILIVIHFFLPSISAVKEPKHSPTCTPFHCGSLVNTSFPFSNITHPDCGLYVINCTGQTPTIDLKGGRQYEVKNIFNNEITIHDTSLKHQLDNKNCNLYENEFRLPPATPSISFELRNPNLTLIKCPSPLQDIPFEVNTYEGCKDDYLIYYIYPEQHKLSQLPKSRFVNCSVVQLPLKIDTPPPPDVWKNDPFALLSAEFSLEWTVSEDCVECFSDGDQCLENNRTKEFQCSTWQNGCETNICNKANVNRKVAIGAGAAVGVVILALSVFMLIRYVRKEFSSDDSLSARFWKKETNNDDHQNVQAFLNNYGSSAPKRFKYLDIKKITNSFKEKLGQGGYGSVFKGQLHDGRLVAVKVLISKPKSNNGEEFINEVASISRTSHLNVVTLLGFCFERNKRALIYEFMPNGSLDKFIYGEKLPLQSGLTLGWEALYRVAIGIARGLEYLHRGCNIRILHFDIKPHNILLDENFCPKISDFGLAKLCPGTESKISMFGARGTAGYIAPEVFSRNFGAVSHKSDVYSYGMMVLEMVGGRKNIDVKVGMDHSSQLYFPHWIYDRLKLDEGLGLHEVMTEERERATRKMIIVGLWCIQTNPSSRPTMSKVLEMLEGSIEALQIPPKPFLSSPPRSPSLMDSGSIISSS